jgi:proline iminopeptidase
VASSLAARPASQPSAARSRPGRTFTANGVKLWYDVLGEKRGTPLVVVNGGPGFDHLYMLSTDVWDRISRRRQVVVYDQRGTGRSEPYRADGSQTVDTHVADLEALRVELGAEKLDLAGHSWGGYLSMAYATKHPERTSRLVLVGSGAPRLDDTKILLHEYFPDEMDRYEASAMAILDGGAPEGGKAALRDLVTAMFYSADRRDEFLERNADLYLNQAMNQVLEVATTGVDMWPAVRALRTPTLIINGRFDANVAPETAWKIHQAIAGSRIRYFERSGHFPFVEEPDLFVEVVEPFLDGK